MKLINNVRHTNCQYGVEADIQYGVLKDINQWCRDNLGHYYIKWDWINERGVRTFCFNSEELRTWFIMRWSHEL